MEEQKKPIVVNALSQLAKATNQQPQRSPLLRFFEYSHLPEPMFSVSRACWILAENMEAELPAGPEKTAGLRKLLEAKDCFVRAKLPAPK